jgi:hypothetical protein
VQKINTRAEKKVEGEFNKELKRIRGKESILLRLAEAAVAEAGRHGSQSDLSGGRGVHAEGAGGEGRGERGALPGQGADGAALVVLQPMAADAFAAGGCAGAEVQQHPYRPVMDAIDQPMTDPQQPSPTDPSDADDVEQHACPKCDAQPGSPCRSRGGAVASAYHTRRFTMSLA